MIIGKSNFKSNFKIQFQIQNPKFKFQITKLNELIVEPEHGRSCFHKRNHECAISYARSKKWPQNTDWN